MMHSPSHPGRIIAENLEALNLSVAESAKALGTTRQQLHRVITGKSSVSPEMAVRLEKGFGGSVSFWLKLQANFDAAQIRKRADTIHVERLVAKVA